MLREQIGKHRQFCFTYRGEPIRWDVTNTAWQNALRKSGIVDFRFHDLRHTHATHALARGAELTTVRDNLRHASVSTTSIYLHSDEAKRARQISAAFGGSDDRGDAQA